MTPFLQFRMWLRQGPPPERVLVAIASVVILALGGWALVPITGNGNSAVATGAAGARKPAGATAAGGASDGASASTDAGQATASGAGGVTSGAGGAGGATPNSVSGSTPGDATATAPGCDHAASDVGVSETEIRIGIVLVDLGNLNAALGIDPYDKEVALYNGLIDQVNQAGGIQCRNIVPVYYRDNVLDSAGEHSLCLQMQQDNLLVVLNNLFTPQEATCPAQAGIPNLWYTPVHDTDVQAYYPNIFTFRPHFDQLIKDYVFGLRQYGYFDGVGKIGVLEGTCFPDENTAIIDNLHAAGFGDNLITTYNYGCPQATSTPADNTAAVLQFKSQNVTHVMNVAYQNAMTFAQAAAQQNFHPKYGFMDDNLASLIQNASPAADPSLDGALMITSDQTGAENMPNSTFSQATQDCVALTQAIGVGSPLEPGTTAAPLRGIACAHIQLLKAIAAKASPLTRASLVPTLATLGSVDLSFVAGPNNFNDPQMPAGGQFWRVQKYSKDCTCMLLVDGTFYPNF
jgi:hypothetical protein